MVEKLTNAAQLIYPLRDKGHRSCLSSPQPWTQLVIRALLVHHSQTKRRTCTPLKDLTTTPTLSWPVVQNLKLSVTWIYTSYYLQTIAIWSTLSMNGVQISEAKWQNSNLNTRNPLSIVLWNTQFNSIVYPFFIQIQRNKVKWSDQVWQIGHIFHNIRLQTNHLKKISWRKFQFNLDP